MREILFRGKCVELCKYQGQWLEGFYGEDDGRSLISHSTDIGLIGYACDPDSIGEYTSLKDKNGKRIYEGDVVKVSYLSTVIVYVVIWRNGAFVRECYDGVWLPLDDRPDEYEVIGNIHDEPELFRAKRYE